MSKSIIKKLSFFVVVMTAFAVNSKDSKEINENCYCFINNKNGDFERNCYERKDGDFNCYPINGGKPNIYYKISNWEKVEGGTQYCGICRKDVKSEGEPGRR